MAYCDNIDQNISTSKEVSNLIAKEVIVKLNDRLRKKLAYNTPVKLMAEHIAA